MLRSEGVKVSLGIPWEPTDRVGGPLDEVFDSLRARFPDLQVERLPVVHPNDDDNLWYIGRRGVDLEAQIETTPDYSPPFLIEFRTEREDAESVRGAVERLSEWLRE